MTRETETLTRLVAERVGDGREITYRAFEERAVDPETQYRPSKATIWKVAKGQEVKVNPALIRAFAAGLGLPQSRVQAAAAFQYTGYVATALGGGTVVHEPGASAEEMPKAKAIMDRWEEEESAQDDRS